MPKVNGIKKYIIEFGEEVFSTDGDILFCKICSIKVNSDKRFTVTHLYLVLIFYHSVKNYLYFNRIKFNEILFI